MSFHKILQEEVFKWKNKVHKKSVSFTRPVQLMLKFTLAWAFLVLAGCAKRTLIRVLTLFKKKQHYVGD